jgi:hypothetical protein
MIDYLSQKYKDKVESCISALKEFETSRSDFEKKYINTLFENSDINKLTTFLNLLNFKKIEPETISYLSAKCDDLKHFKDNRAGFEYAIDLMLGWLVEDSVSFFLSKNNIHASLNGADSNREFLKRVQISSDADLSVKSGNLVNLEVFCDWSNTWERYNHADFRDQKFQKLKNTNSLVLGISPKISKGFIIDVNRQSHIFKYSNSIKGYGGKPGYSICNIRKYLLPLNEIQEKLISTF